MRDFSDIKHRMKSVSDTQKITGAMETISVAKMRKALERYESNKAYFETIRHAINDIILYTKSVEHRIFDRPKNPAAFVVIASDKGLAGGFNHDILAYAQKEIEGNENSHIFAVGQVAAEYFLSHDKKVDIAFADASYDPSISQAAEMSEALINAFENGEIGSAYLVYTSMGEHGKMQPESIRLLPFDRESVLSETELSADQRKALQEFEYEPSPEEVLDSLIPQYLTGVIYGALIQSAACEHSQRRAAMSNATKNAFKILEELRLEYNRARQETVTGELIDIVTAVNGVKR